MAATGNLTTQEYRVTGPVMIFLTTTAIEIDEELMNRCIVLTADEGRAQTKAIHHLQRARRTLDGLMAKQGKEAILTLHRNAQRLLRPLAVVNPYAGQLTFLADGKPSRDYDKPHQGNEKPHVHEWPGGVREHPGRDYYRLFALT